MRQWRSTWCRGYAYWKYSIFIISLSQWLPISIIQAKISEYKKINLKHPHLQKRQSTTDVDSLLNKLCYHRLNFWRQMMCKRWNELSDSFKIKLDRWRKLLAILKYKTKHSINYHRIGQHVVTYQGFQIGKIFPDSTVVEKQALRVQVAKIMKHVHFQVWCGLQFSGNISIRLSKQLLVWNGEAIILHNGLDTVFATVQYLFRCAFPVTPQPCHCFWGIKVSGLGTLISYALHQWTMHEKKWGHLPIPVSFSR